MHLELCLCAEMPSLACKTELIVVMHAQEIYKSSNTGRYLPLCLQGASMMLRGLRDGPPLDYEKVIHPEKENLLLCMNENSVELTTEFAASFTKPVRLIVPDGTWSQASRTASQLVKKLPVRPVKLCADGERIYELRSEHDPNGMSTFEAATRALEILEGGSIRSVMDDFFQKMNDRVMFTRGKIPAHEVHGGIPPRKR